MARDEFFQNVRIAIQFVAPTVETDNPYTRPKDLEKSLRAAAIWLTPRSVEGFHEQDFADLSPEQRLQLHDAVDRFRRIASEVPSASPATKAQVRAALPPFMKVVTTVQDIMRHEWKEAVEGVIQNAEEWSADRDWATKRDERRIAEDFLGTYTLPSLLILKGTHRLILEPVARFVIGSCGLVELANWPAYDSIRIIRSNGQWYVKPLEEGKRRKWSEEVFVEAATELSNRV